MISFVIFFGTDPRIGNGIACTGQRNKQIVQGLLPNRKYIVDLFGVHAKIGGMTFKLGTTTILFNRSTPTELIDSRNEMGKLTRFDRKAVFIFKVRNARNRCKYLLYISNKFLIIFLFFSERERAIGCPVPRHSLWLCDQRKSIQSEKIDFTKRNRSANVAAI